MVSIEGGVDVGPHAARVYNRLVECGWLKTERTGHKEYVFMSARVIELLEFIESAGQNLSSAVGGSVFSIHQTLLGIQGEKATSSDITSSLQKTVDDSRLISRRMSRLATYMREMSEKIGEQSELSYKFSLFFDGFINESSFSDYKDIKSNNHPFRFKSEILGSLRTIEYDPIIYARFISAIRENNGLDADGAATILRDSLGKIRSIFIHTDNLLDRIDKSHNKLIRRVTEAAKYQQRSETGLSNSITDALDKLKTIDYAGDLLVVNPLPSLFALSAGALYKPKQRKRPIPKSSGVAVRKVSEDEILLQAAKRGYMDSIRVTDRSLSSWVAGLFSDPSVSDGRVRSRSLLIDTPAKFYLFVQARRLCMDNKEFRSRYPKTARDYSFVLIGDEQFDHGPIICRQFEMKRQQTTGGRHV